MRNITSNNISVIVRGLIVGQSESDPNKQYTRRSLESIRKHLPHAQIILSSWSGSDVTGLDYDELVLSDEPEKIYLSQENEQKKMIAANHQITSTKNGLEKADRAYVISMRSDIVLTHTRFTSYFLKYNQVGPDTVVSKRILTLPTYNPRKSPFLFDVCDWFYFGARQDIEKLFSIPLMKEENLHGKKINGLYPIKENLESEQYIWTTFLKENNYPANIQSLNEISPELMNLSEQSYARYTIMIPAPKLGIVCLKMPYAGYGASPWLSQGLYTLTEYNHMYNKYNPDTILYVPNIVELFLYPLAFSARKLIAKINPSLYKKMVNLIRNVHGSNNLLK